MFTEDSFFQSRHIVVSEFSLAKWQRPHHGIINTPKRPRLDREYSAAYFCSEPNCICTFQTKLEYEQHIYSGEHTFVKLKTPYDEVKQNYMNILQGYKSSISSDANQSSETNIEEDSHNVTMLEVTSVCWALSERKTTRFSSRQNQFLLENFIYGEQNGRKQRPEQVAQAMRMVSLMGK